MEKQLFDGEQIRCRVVLKGNAILDEAGERPLDGQAFGELRGDGTVNLRLADSGFASGDGLRGGDFESWFWLTF